MTWWISLLVIAAIVCLIGMIPVGVDGRYCPNGISVQIKIWMFSVQILPKKETRKPKRRKKKAPEQPQQKPKKKLPIPGGIDGIFSLMDLAADTLGNLKRKIRVNTLRLHVLFGSKDPAKAAIGYGRAWAVIGAITPMLERWFVIKKRDIQPSLDYNEQEMKIDAHLVLTITVGRILALAARAGIRFLMIMKQNEKGGAKDESSSVRNDELLDGKNSGNG